MKVLVTGANGMLGTNVIESLLEKGYEVRGLLRRRSSYIGITHQSLELFEGDFTNGETISVALDGCDAVIHSAAIITQELLHYEDYLRVNVEATGQLLKSAQAHQIKKIVFISTANTIGYGAESLPGTENTPCNEPLSRSLYGRSKAAAERLVIEANGIIVNPTFMLGRYGTPAGSNQIMKLANRITICPSGGNNFIDVEDAAQGVVAALEHGKACERYLIANENLLFKEFFSRFSHVRKVIVLPEWAMISIGFMGSVARTLGIKTQLSVTNARILCLPMAYDNSKARKELKFNIKLKEIRECLHSI